MVQLNPLALVMDDTHHDYEDINVVLGRLPPRPSEFNITPKAIPRSDTKEEIGTDPCPAYEATTKPVHLEPEYEMMISGAIDTGESVQESTT
jgi:hypothetical protein